MELPSVGVGEQGEGVAIAGLRPGQNRSGHRFLPPFHVRPPGSCNTKGGTDSSLNPAAVRCSNCRRNQQSDRRLSMTPVSPHSGLAEDQRRIPAPPHLGASLPTPTAREVGSESAVRRWRAFALLVVGYFMTIVDP